MCISSYKNLSGWHGGHREGNGVWSGREILFPVNVLLEYLLCPHVSCFWSVWMRSGFISSGSWAPRSRTRIGSVSGPQPPGLVSWSTAGGPGAVGGSSSARSLTMRGCSCGNQVRAASRVALLYCLHFFFFFKFVLVLLLVSKRK